MQKVVAAFDDGVATDTLPAVPARSAVLVGSAILLHIEDLPFTPLIAGTGAAPISDRAGDHGDSPSGD